LRRGHGRRALLAAVLVAVALAGTAMNETVAAAAPAPAEVVANPDEGDPPGAARNQDEGEPPGSAGPDEGEPPGRIANRDEGDPPDTSHGDGGGEAIGQVAPAPAGPPPALAPEQKKDEPQLAAPGAAAIGQTNRQILAFGPMKVPGNTVWQQWRNCPSGMRAVSGGEFNDSTFGDVELIHLGPTPRTGEGWIVNVRNKSPNPANLTVYAVCVGGLEDYLFTEGPHVFTGPGEPGVTSASCTDGRVVTGGGIWPVPNTVSINTLLPGDTGVAWANYFVNTGSQTVDAWPYAVCVKGLQNHRVVRSDLVPFSSPGYGSATATCPADSPTMVGGGVFSSVSGNQIAVTDFFPLSEKTWMVYVRSRANTGTANVRVRVICAA
jgi:hypothetical protein